MQVQITFDRVEFLKPYRFFLLIKTATLSKRTEIAETSETPNFSHKTIAIGEPADVQISACIVLDYDGRLDSAGQTLVFGGCTISKESYLPVIEGGKAYQQLKQFVQETTGGRLVVGHVGVTVNYQRKEMLTSYVENIDEFSMEEVGEPASKAFESNQHRVCVDLHCGSDFPADSGFFVQVGWTEKYQSSSPKYLQSSRIVQQNMHPVWGQQLLLPLTKNMTSGFLTILLKDKDNSILERASFPLSKLLPFHHYHVELVSTHQIKLARPRLFFTFVLQALSEKNLTDEICQLIVTNIDVVPELPINKRIVFILANNPKQGLFFNRLEVNKEGTAELQLLQHCTNSPSNYFMSPILTTPLLSTIQTDDAFVFRMRILKSELLRHNFLSVVDIPSNQKMVASIPQPIMISQDCTSIIRRAFYNEERQVIMLETTNKETESSGERQCYVEIGTQTFASEMSKSVRQPQRTFDPVHQKWKMLSNDVKLKQKLIHSMRKEVEDRTASIVGKGDSIQSLRRAEVNLKKRNQFLLSYAKQQQQIHIAENALPEKTNVGRLYDSLIGLTQSLAVLIKRNEQDTVELEAAQSMEQQQLNTDKLEQEYIRNRELLKEMQERIHKLPVFNKIVRKQKASILKLQTAFEKSQIDQQMNEILNRQLKQLEGKKIKPARTANATQHQLQKILEHIGRQKHQKRSPASQRLAILRREIAQAEDELRRKSEYYAKLLFRSEF